MMPGDTIFALSSGRGRSGVAVVRLSGPEAGRAVTLLVGDCPPPRRLSLRHLSTASGEVIDQALVAWLPGPRTVTGEDVAEFHVHGSPAVVSRLLEELSTFENLRPAEAGEFTRRAFENGRLDLVEVEGLSDLLAAETEAQRKLAMRQYLGEASDVYEAWRLRILECLAYVEAAIDFVDEDGVAEQSVVALRPRLDLLIETLVAAQSRALQASAARRGLSVVIAGAPNAGKSSLMNVLAGRDVSIVSPIAGTTRDLVSDVIVIAGVPVRLVDTAGLRAVTSDSIETEGIRRATKELEGADVLVWLQAADEAQSMASPRPPDLIVISKADLAPLDSIRSRYDESIAVSIINGVGLDEFREAIAGLIRERLSAAEDGTMVRARHADAVNKALTLLRSACQHDAASLELMAEDVRKAALALASITGRVDVEDVLGQIFADFCIGK